MPNPITHIVSSVLELGNPDLNATARKAKIAVLENTYDPLKLEDIIQLATLQSQRETRVAVEYVERDIHWIMKRYWGDVSDLKSYTNGDQSF